MFKALGTVSIDVHVYNGINEVKRIYPTLAKGSDVHIKQLQTHKIMQVNKQKPCNDHK